MDRLPGRWMKRALLAGIQWFSHFRGQVDAINVFPVADGDTGKNMHHALQSAQKEIEAVRANSTADVAWAAARGALNGSRGCSGMILSGFFSGFAEAVGNRKTLSAQELATAFQMGCLRARERVEQPLEGTILTVGEAAAHQALDKAKQSPRLADILRSAWEGAQSALQRTPQQLTILKKNRVVDAGGMGLVYFLEGMVRYVHRQSLDDPGDHGQRVDPDSRPAAKKSTVGDCRFCTELILQGQNLQRQDIVQLLKPLGEEMMIAAVDAQTFKIHLHSRSPEEVFKHAETLGSVQWKKVDDMLAQHQHLQHYRRARPQKPQAHEGGKHRIPTQGV